MENLASVWQEAAAQLEDTLPETKKQWIKRISFEKEEEGRLILSLSSDFYREMTEKNCRADIENTVSEIAGRDVAIDFIVDRSKKTVQKAPARTVRKEKTETASKNTTLNKQYSFDNFISGDNSSFAFNACKVIAQNPGTSFNPCLIYGGVGLGKTHLLESIGNYVETENPRKNVVYVTAETFTNDYIQSLTNKNTSQFRIKYRKADILLIDDIHFLEKKIQTQEELFHTFNDLYETNKQIVFTCDRPISELKGFTDRLKSRFTRGLNINLTAPDYETRVAILRKKCEDKGVRIYDSVLNYIAENIKTNVRDLEGSLTTLIAYSNLIKTKITLEVAQEHLKNIIATPMASEQDISIGTIVKEVASYFSIEISDIKGKKRTAIIKDARNVAIYLTRKITQYSTTEIGTYFDRDHSTITHSIDKVEKERKTNSELAQTLDTLETRIRKSTK